MAAVLQALLEGMQLVSDEAELRQEFVPRLKEHFSAKRCAVFFIRDLNPAVAAVMQGNPVVRYLLERHAPVHEGVLVSPSRWRALCQRFDHGHVMAGPVVHEGKLYAVVGLTREVGSPAFNAEELADLTAICLHLSSWLATHRIKNEHTLTEREAQIAGLVAQGLTNAQIGTELCISENTVKAALKTMFRKLEVVSRAELVARLSR